MPEHEAIDAFHEGEVPLLYSQPEYEAIDADRSLFHQSEAPLHRTIDTSHHRV